MKRVKSSEEQKVVYYDIESYPTGGDMEVQVMFI